MRARILVVDDDPGMRRAVQRVLEPRNDVVTAGSTDEALARACEEEFDLAIVDIRMPGADGFELVSRLREVRPGTDVILMTGSVGETDQKLVRAIRQKAFYFIHKPFEREVLLALVDRCLELRSLAAQNRRHTQRLEAALDQARSFQQSLLPEPCAVVSGVRIDARLVACEELSGDLFDYAAGAGDRVVFVVADVSGHGVSAAMLTGVVKAAFRSAHADEQAPLAVAHAVSAGLRVFEPNRFVTLFCGALHAAHGRLEFVSAGHPPALLWDGDTESWLGATGPPITSGLPDAKWEASTVSFGTSARLLVYSDGIVEAYGEAGEYGGERLAQLATKSGESGASLIDRLLGAVADFTGGQRPRDDRTILVVSRD